MGCEGVFLFGALFVLCFVLGLLFVLFSFPSSWSVRCNYLSKACLLPFAVNYHIKVLKTYLYNPFTKLFVVRHVDHIAVSFHCQMNLITLVIHLVFMLFLLFLLILCNTMLTYFKYFLERIEMEKANRLNWLTDQILQ